jgi:hypothetical protein
MTDTAISHPLECAFRTGISLTCSLNFNNKQVSTNTVYQFYSQLVSEDLGIDIQKGVHDCVVDAQYTMKLFREYQKLARERNVNNRFANFEENEFDEVKKMK